MMARCKMCGQVFEIKHMKTLYCDSCKPLARRAQGREYSRRRFGYTKVYVNCKSRLREEEMRV